MESVVLVKMSILDCIQRTSQQKSEKIKVNETQQEGTNKVTYA
jgi:hypothetical protein